MSLNLFEPYRGSALYWMKPKRSGGDRLICALPRPLSLRHKILSDVIRNCVPLEKHLYLVKGRGRDVLARDVQSALRSGYRFGWQADIRSAYENTHITGFLRDRAPIPETVIRNTLYYTETTFRRVRKGVGINRLERTVYMPMASHAVLEGPRGLIQGAASSSAIFNLTLNDLHQAVDTSVRLFVYGDNILALAKNEDDRDAAGCHLGLALRSHPAGPFQLTENNVSLSRGFEHLGYRFLVGRASGLPEVWPGQKKYLSLLTTMMEAVEQDLSHNLPLSIRARNMSRAPLNGYPAVSDRGELSKELIFFAETGVFQQNSEFLQRLSCVCSY